MRLDHVILACPAGLAAGAARLERDTGLRTVAGGQHRSLGTANRVLPLVGGAYLELAGVVDPVAAARTPFGRLLRRATAHADRPVPAAWCVAVDSLDLHAARLGLAPMPGSRVRPDGTELRWWLAGVETSLAEPYLPFLIRWDVAADAHPGAVPYDGPAVSLVEIRLTGDARRLSDWLAGGLDLTTVVIHDGPPAVQAVVLDVDGRTVVLCRP